MSDTISTDAAKSTLRVTLANAIARTVVSIIATLDETGTPMTENQQTAILSVAIMEYRSYADDGEKSIDAEILLWATAEETRALFDSLDA